MSEVGSAQRENAVPEISFYSDTYTITSAMALTINHGLPKVPRQTWLRLKCITAELGYAIGDEATLAPYASGTGQFSVVSNSTQIKVVFSSLPYLVNYSTGASAAITATNWQLVIKAEV